MFAGNLWKQVTDNGGMVWLAVEEGNMPIIEPPNPDFDNYAALSLFTTQEGAEDFREFVIESSDTRPSMIKVISLNIQEIWGMIDELCVFCEEEFESKLIIRLVNAQKVQQIVEFDTIYKQDEMKEMAN